MKLHFIEAKATIDLEMPKELLKEFPDSIAIAAATQFVDKLPKFVEFLKENGKGVTLIRGNHAKHWGQIVGCSYSDFRYDNENEFEAFLYIGDGLFHPKAMILNSGKEVFTFDPFIKKITKLDKTMMDEIKRLQKVNRTKFLHAKNIGVLVTTKPGQMSVQAKLLDIFSLKEKFPDKNFYYIAVNTLDFNQLDNFSFIDAYVNTACNRLIDDTDKFPKPMINIEEAFKLSN